MNVTIGRGNMQYTNMGNNINTGVHKEQVAGVRACNLVKFEAIPSYTITCLLPLVLLLMLCTRNNTDGNKLVIFSGIAHTHYKELRRVHN